MTKSTKGSRKNVPNQKVVQELQDLTQLALRDRAILLLRLAGRTTPEISHEMGLSASSISKICRRAIRQITAEPAKELVGLQQGRAEKVLSYAWDGLQRALENMDERLILLYLSTVDRAMARLDVYYNIARSEATENDYARLAREGGEMVEMFERFVVLRAARFGLPSPDGHGKGEIIDGQATPADD